MNYYFRQVNVTDGLARMTYSIQRIRKGKNNQATNWANGKMEKLENKPTLTKNEPPSTPLTPDGHIRMKKYSQ
jgi:hypothetical protein